MYHRLGNLYSSQRLGSFESDGTGFGDAFKKQTKQGRILGHRPRDISQMSSEALATKLTEKEAKIVQLQRKMANGTADKNAAKRLGRMQVKATKIREVLASRKNVDLLDGLDVVASPVGIGAVAILAVAGYWFVVRPKMAAAMRRSKRNKRRRSKR